MGVLKYKKALSAAAFIAKSNLKDTARSDSLYRLVLERYPEGEFGRKALIELNAIEDSDVTTRKGMAEAAFLAAQRKYCEEGDVKGAVQAFFNIYKTYSDLDIAAKSLYTAAWLTDNELRKKSTAKKLYEKICERYPNSDYCTKEAKPRIQTALDTLKAYGQITDAPQTTPHAAKEKKPAAVSQPAADTGHVTPADSGHAAPVAPVGQPGATAGKPAASAPPNSKVPEDLLNGARALMSQPKQQPAVSDSTMTNLKKQMKPASDSATAPTSGNPAPAPVERPTSPAADSAASHTGTPTITPAQPASKD